jgi:peptidoglycan/LPS O-acetylase OafA/YrhL
LRNRYLDLLRAVAIVRVVVYHVTGWSVLTIIFPAMPVMFALAGSLMAASIDKAGAAAIGKRLRRLLPSLWVLTVIFVPAMLLTGLAWDWKILLWALPLEDPPANDWGAQALSANWYLRDFLWFVLLSPAALWLFRRRPVLTLAVPYLMLLALEFVHWQPHVIVRDIGLYFGAWLLGFAHHDGLLKRLGTKRLLAVAGGLAVTGVLWIWQHPGPRGYDLNDIHLGNALWAGAFILVALGCAPRAERFEGTQRWWHRPVTVLNSRALTIYLWHVPILTGVTRLAEQHGWPVLSKVGITWRLVVVFAGVAVAVALFGWVEDIAGRRRPVLVPGARRPRTTVPTQTTAGVRAVTRVVPVVPHSPGPVVAVTAPVLPGAHVTAPVLPGAHVTVPATPDEAELVGTGAGPAVFGSVGPALPPSQTSPSAHARVQQRSALVIEPAMADTPAAAAPAVWPVVVSEPHPDCVVLVTVDGRVCAPPDRPRLALPVLLDLAAARTGHGAPHGARPGTRTPITEAARRTGPRRSTVRRRFRVGA